MASINTNGVVVDGGEAAFASPKKEVDRKQRPKVARAALISKDT